MALFDRVPSGHAVERVCAGRRVPSVTGRGEGGGGEGLLLAYKRCRARAEVWATQDEFLAMQEEEVGGKGGREEEDEDEEGRFMGEGDERFWGEGGMEGTRGENESRSNTNAGRKWQ